MPAIFTPAGQTNAQDLTKWGMGRIPSSGKRANGRLQSSTPTINEFEDLREGLDDDLGLGSLGRNESLGTRSSGSLHRATPVPMDLSSSSSSGPKFTNHRLSTPTIKEDETDRFDILSAPPLAVHSMVRQVKKSSMILRLTIYSLGLSRALNTRLFLQTVKTFKAAREECQLAHVMVIHILRYSEADRKRKRFVQ